MWHYIHDIQDYIINLVKLSGVNCVLYEMLFDKVYFCCVDETDKRQLPNMRPDKIFKQ